MRCWPRHCHTKFEANCTVLHPISEIVIIYTLNQWQCKVTFRITLNDNYTIFFFFWQSKCIFIQVDTNLLRKTDQKGIKNKCEITTKDNVQKEKVWASSCFPILSSPRKKLYLKIYKKLKIKKKKKKPFISYIPSKWLATESEFFIQVSCLSPCSATLSIQAFFQFKIHQYQILNR